MSDWKTIETPKQGTFSAVVTNVAIEASNVHWHLTLLDGSSWKFLYATPLTGPQVTKSADMCRVLGTDLHFKKSEVLGKKLRVVINKDGSVSKVKESL